MTDVKFDFNSNIKFLLEKNLSNSIKNDIVTQDKILNSNDFNVTFKYIEDSLNFLYEKNRVLEDIIKYSDLYLKNEINNIVAECKSILNSIEENRDLIKDNNYVKFSVPLVSEVNSHVDRNNKVINSTSLYNNTIVSSSNKINSYSPNKVSIKQTDINFNMYNSIDTFFNANSYRSFYMFNNPKNEALAESLTLTFDSAVKINKINLNTSNCIIDTITLLLDDDSKVVLKKDIGLFKACYVKQITIDIKCSNYILSQVNYKDYKNNDFWDTINKIKTDENLIVDKSKYYYYLFGIDNLEISYSTVNKESVFISKEINIGSLNENEYITLQASDSIERGDVEYYIIDGTTNIPILPEDKHEIINEKIFYKTETRFPCDITKPIVIKKNGEEVNITLYQAINTNTAEDIYTVSYTPIINNVSKLNNDKIKIKAIIRNYDENFYSFIKGINIKKYGGGKLWIDKI